MLLIAVLVGCDRGSGADNVNADARVGGAAPPSVPPILQPFQGAWRFNQTKTLAQWQADGVPPTEIAETQKIAAQFPMHPDMNIQSDTAILTGGGMPLEGSYQFFALHPHKQWVCGKAWHHEDRHDPGDMDKYVIRMEVKNNQLYLTFRVPEDAADPNDPDVSKTPLLDGNAATCTADALTDPPWSPWRTYVFDRDEQKK